MSQAAQDWFESNAPGSSDDWFGANAPSDDALTTKTQEAAAAAGAPTRPAPKPAIYQKPPVGTPFPAANPIEAAGKRLDRVSELQERAKRSPTPFTDASNIYAPVAAARQIVGSKIGAYAGSNLAPYVGVSPETGELVGGAVGGLAGTVGPGASADEPIERFRNARRVDAGQTKLIDTLKIPGGRAGSNGIKMEANVETALPHVAQAFRDAPLETKGVEQMAEGASRLTDYMGDWWDTAHVDQIKRHAVMPTTEVNGVDKVSQIRDRLLSQISPQDDSVEARQARNWINREVTPQKIGTVGDMDTKIRLMNQQLANKGVAGGYGNVLKRVMFSGVDEMRGALDESLIAAGEDGVKQFNSEYGAMRAIRDRLLERYFQEAPKDARSGFTPNWLREYAFWHGGSPAVGLSMRIGKMLVPTEAGRFASAVKDLANSHLEAPIPSTPGYVSRRPIALLPAAGETSQSLTPMERGPQGGPGPNMKPSSIEMPASSAQQTKLPPPPSAFDRPTEVMRQPLPTSRATPTGEAISLPPEIHAALEKQAGRKLTVEEAIALDRANLERGMALGPEGDTNTIREAHREKLEGKGRKGPPPPPKSGSFDF